MAVFDEQTDGVERVGEERLKAVFVDRQSRQVRSDSTLQFEGTTWEVDQRFLCSRTVDVCRPLLNPQTDPWVECEGSRYEIHRVDPKENARRERTTDDAPEDDEPDSSSVPFAPNETNLDRAAARPSSTSSETGD